MLYRFGFNDLSIVLRDLAQVLFFSAFCFLAPLPIALFFGEPPQYIFSYVIVALLVYSLSLLLKRFFSSDSETQLKHAFLVVSLIWLVFSVFAALPFVLVQGSSFFDGLFEAMSSVTTTGLSVLDSEVDSMPQSLIFWRSFLGWIGGLGIIVLALMGIVSAYATSSKLFFAEGRDDSIKPNLRHTVKELWKIYIGITVLGVVLLFFSGMGFFDALNYSMSTVSTTGFNTSSEQAGFHPSLLTEIVLTLLLVIGATNFSLHYFFLKKKSFQGYLGSTEFRAMLLFSTLGSLLVLPKIAQLTPSLSSALRVSFFHAFSAALGGSATVSSAFFSSLDQFALLVFILLMFIGGSSGSTSGGIKVSRFLILLKQVYWKIKEVSLPKNVFFSKKFEGTEIEPNRLSDINHFVILYVGLLLFGTFVLTFQSHDLALSLFETVSAQGNAGISAGLTFKGMPFFSQLLLIVLMWAGRLDILPLFAFAGLLLSARKNKGL